MHGCVLIVGPTGSGKSALAMTLAEANGGVILNCDSLQTYQRLNIGTAKPLPAELARVPHFLLDVVPPGQVLTAGDFRRLAMAVLERELPRRPVFAVGGSGFYIQALEKGMFDIPKPPPEVEAEVREESQRLGLAAMFARLAAADPETAERLSPNDSYRILRALVICRATGKTVSQLRREFSGEKFPYPLLKLGLNPSRAELLPRIWARSEAMLAAGLIDEVRTLLSAGLVDWPPLMSVGYKEVRAFLRGEMAQEKLLPMIVEKTMQLAKKQKTWFKRDTEIHWLPVSDPLPRALDLLAGFLDSGSPS